MKDKNLLIETTIMAIRERLMEYYKGTCVERFTEDSNIYINELPYRGNHNYQRDEFMRTMPSELFIGNLPILAIKKNPDEITFYDNILGRSPQLRQVKQELERFVEKYLGAIETKHDERGVVYA